MCKRRDVRRLLPSRLFLSFHIKQPNMMVTMPMNTEARPKAILIVLSGEISRECRAGIALTRFKENGMRQEAWRSSKI